MTVPVEKWFESWSMSQQSDIIIRGDGTIVLFGVHNHYKLDLPSKLMCKLAPEEFRYTVRQINQLLDNQIHTNCLFFLSGCLLCFCTAGMTLGPSLWLNRKTKGKIRCILEKENKRIYNSLGMNWSLVKEKFGLSTEYCLQIEFIKTPQLIGPD